MFIVFWVVVAGMVVISKVGGLHKTARTLHVDRKLFHVDGAFAFGSAVVCLLVAAIYGAWW
jgi:SSS family solute:Na+ symporter